MRMLLCLAVMLNVFFAKAEAGDIQLPQFAVIKPEAEALDNHRWSYYPSSQVDTYKYSANSGKGGAGVIIQVGNNLSSLYAQAQKNTPSMHTQSEVFEAPLSSESAHWIKFECKCHGARSTVMGLAKTGLQHLDKDIWMHITIKGNDNQLKIYQQWLGGLTLSMNDH